MLRDAPLSGYMILSLLMKALLPRSIPRQFPALFLLIITGILFAPFFFANRVLAPLDIVHEMYQPWKGLEGVPKAHNHFVTDAVTQYIPYRLFFHESLRSEGTVGWNALIFGGTAQHANTMLINHEVTTVLHRFLDFWPAWTLGRLLQFLVAGIGMLIFLQSRKYGVGISCFGGVAFMLNQQFIAWIYFNQIVASFCWVPWLLWALFLAREQSSRYAAPAALFVGLALLGATLQQAAFILAVLACVALGWWLEDWGKPSRQVRGVSVLALAGLLGAGLAAFALQPNISAFLENAEAGHHRGEFAYGSGLQEALSNLLGIPFTSFPFWLGSVQTLDLWKLFKLDLFNIGFFGTLPMAIACVAFFSRPVPLVAKLLMACGILVPLSPLVGFLYHRFNIVWILGGCWAACAWLSSTDEKKIFRWVERCWKPFGIVLLLWLLASMAVAMGRCWVEPWLQAKVLAAASSSQFGFFSDWMEARASRLIDYLCIWNPWQLLGVAGFFVSLWGVRCIRDGGPLSLICALGVAMQLSVFWWQWTTWSRPELPYGTTALERLLQKEVGSTGRLALDIEASEELFLPYNTLMPSGIPTTEGYDAMRPHGMRSPTGLKWDFPGTTHFLGKVHGPYPEAWNIVWQEWKWGLWRNPAPSAGRIFFQSLGPVTVRHLLPAEIRWPSRNMIEVKIPAGARAVEIYQNWHRGWEWSLPGDGSWKPVELGENRVIKVVFPENLPTETTTLLRYDADPPSWVRAISWISLAMILLWGWKGGGASSNRQLAVAL